MTTPTKCRAQGGALNCKNPNCPEKRATTSNPHQPTKQQTADRAAFFADLHKNTNAPAPHKTLPSFNNEKDLVAYVTKKYHGKVKYDVQRYAGLYSIQYLSVNNINIDPELRGQGIALHIRHLLQQHADEHNLLIVGTPTDQGDGTIPQTKTNKTYKQHCITHRNRLIRAYLTTGYSHNPFYDYQNTGYWKRANGPKDKNPLTGTFVVRDFETRQRFSTRGNLFLKKLDEFVYFPKGKIPQWMLAEGKPDTFKGWQRPADADTREEQELRHRTQYEAQLAS